MCFQLTKACSTCYDFLKENPEKVCLVSNSYANLLVAWKVFCSSVFGPTCRDFCLQLDEEGGVKNKSGMINLPFFLFHASKDSREKDGKRQQQSRRDHHLTVWCWCDFPQGSGSFSLSVSMPENLGHVQRFARIIIVYYAKIKRMCRPQNLVYVVLFYMEKVRGVVHSIVVYSNMAGVAWSTQNYY